jgi:hypothetical protein
MYTQEDQTKQNGNAWHGEQNKIVMELEEMIYASTAPHRLEVIRQDIRTPGFCSWK